MIERDDVVAPEISWQMCCARWLRQIVEAARRLEHLARAAKICRVTKKGMSASASRWNDTSRLTR